MAAKTSERIKKTCHPHRAGPKKGLVQPRAGKWLTEDDKLYCGYLCKGRARITHNRPVRPKGILSKMSLTDRVAISKYKLWKFIALQRRGVSTK